MYKSGANFADRNLIIKLHQEGSTPEQIRAMTRVNLTTISGICYPPKPDVEPFDDEDDDILILDDEDDD